MHYFPPIVDKKLIKVSPLLSIRYLIKPDLQTSFISEVPRLSSSVNFKQNIVTRPKTAKPGFSRPFWKPYKTPDVVESKPKTVVKLDRPKSSNHKTETFKKIIEKQPDKPKPWYAEKSKSFTKDLEKNFKTVRISKKFSRESSEDRNSSEVPWYENRTQPIYKALQSERPKTTSSISRSHDNISLTQQKSQNRRSKPISGPSFEEWLENIKSRNKTTTATESKQNRVISQEERDRVFKLWLKKKQKNKTNQNPCELSSSSAAFNLPKHTEEQISSAIKIWLKRKNRESRQIRRQERASLPNQEKLQAALEKQRLVEIRAYEKWLAKKNISEVKSKKAELKQVKNERKEKSSSSRYEEVGGEIIAGLKRQKEDLEYKQYLKRKNSIRNRVKKSVRRPESVALPESIAESVEYFKVLKLVIVK